MLIYSFITDYQAFNLRYKDNTTRDKNETKVDKQSANLGKNNEPIQNRLSFLIDCKSVILHHLAILSFPMVRPAWDNWWILQMSMALAALFSIVVAAGMAYKMMVKHEPVLARLLRISRARRPSRWTVRPSSSIWLPADLSPVIKPLK